MLLITVSYKFTTQLEYQENKEISRESMSVYFFIYICYAHPLFIYVYCKTNYIDIHCNENYNSQSCFILKQNSNETCPSNETFGYFDWNTVAFILCNYCFDGANVFKLELERNVFQSKYMCVVNWKVRLQ